MEESSEVIMIDALRLAEGDQRMLKILTGQHKLEPEYEEFNSHHRCRVYSSPSSETLNEANWRNSAAGTSSGVVQHVPLGQKYSVGSRENSIPSKCLLILAHAWLILACLDDSDDVTSLDVVTRLRLSRLLDENRLWEKLATALGCGHMVEMLQCVTDSSPTSLLLDQYEVRGNDSDDDLFNVYRLVLYF